MLAVIAVMVVAYGPAAEAEFKTQHAHVPPENNLSPISEPMHEFVKRGFCLSDVVVDGDGKSVWHLQGFVDSECG